VNGTRDVPLWRPASPTRSTATTLTEHDVLCPFITPEVGITPTLVIDAASRTMFVLARTNEHGVFVQKLHALDNSNGKEKPGSPVVISATVQGPETVPRAARSVSNR
jgi:hypothetical protein